MTDYFLVREGRGPAWDPAKGRREQRGWDEHVAFVDGLVDEGVVVLGGPVGDVDGEHVVLVAHVGSETEIRDRLANDPWMGSILTLESVERWSLWIRAAGGVP
jgi:uncharacterized protein YciI